MNENEVMTNVNDVPMPEPMSDMEIETTSQVLPIEEDEPIATDVTTETENDGFNQIAKDTVETSIDTETTEQENETSDTPKKKRYRRTKAEIERGISREEVEIENLEQKKVKLQERKDSLIKQKAEIEDKLANVEAELVQIDVDIKQLQDANDQKTKHKEAMEAAKELLAKYPNLSKEDLESLLK